MCIFLTMLLFAVSGAGADDVEPPDPSALKTREIKLTAPVFSPAEGRLGEPLKITTTEELTKAVADKEAGEAIAKQVNFKRENLLVFRWAGSGQDRLTFKVEKGDSGEVVVFHYKAGFTRDLRRHVKVVAIPKKATYKVAR